LKKSSSARPALSVSVTRVNGRITALHVSGHAGFAPFGRDIVCSAASALVLSTAHGLAAHCRAKVRVTDDGAGDFHLSVPRGGNARAQALLETTVSGLRAIARSYPQSIRVRAAAGKRVAPPKRKAPTRAAR
jgi:uncharacterized protein